MSVEFNEEQGSTRYPHTTTPKGITGLLIKTGLAKDVKQANLIMLGVIGFMAVIFFISIVSMSGDTTINDYDGPTSEDSPYET